MAVLKFSTLRPMFTNLFTSHPRWSFRQQFDDCFLEKSPIPGENIQKNIDFRPLSAIFPFFTLLVQTLFCFLNDSSREPRWTVTSEWVLLANGQRGSLMSKAIGMKAANLMQAAAANHRVRSRLRLPMTSPFCVHYIRSIVNPGHVLTSAP